MKGTKQLDSGTSERVTSIANVSLIPRFLSSFFPLTKQTEPTFCSTCYVRPFSLIFVYTFMYMDLRVGFTVHTIAD